VGLWNYNINCYYCSLWLLLIGVFEEKMEEAFFELFIFVFFCFVLEKEKGVNKEL